MVVAAETVAAKAIADAAAKAPAQPRPRGASKKAADALAALNTELAAAKKADDRHRRGAEGRDRQARAQPKTYTDAMATLAENQKKVAALTPMVKPATDAVAPGEGRCSTPRTPRSRPRKPLSTPRTPKVTTSEGRARRVKASVAPQEVACNGSRCHTDAGSAT